jgi:RNA 3'-phosphate cyclase
MLEIDGSLGEGGGQMLRTSVAMSAIKGQPIRIRNIRSGRENPGLRPQHLKAVEAVGLLCDAEVTGLSVGSTEVSFTPGKIKAGNIRVDIGTAGSITLLLQALLPVALSAPGEVSVEVIGGTDVSHSPTIDYFEHVFLPVIRGIGCDVGLVVQVRGFYPKGGGQVKVNVKPWSHPSRLSLIEAGAVGSVEVFSTATEHLRKQEVAQRQVNGFLRNVSPNFEVKRISRQYVQSPSIGSSFLAVARYENSAIGACVLGERGLKAEDVGAKAAQELIAEIDSKAPLDSHMADQILPYLALAGGQAKVSHLTEHAKTNIETLKTFGYGLKTGDNIIYAPWGA